MSGIGTVDAIPPRCVDTHLVLAIIQQGFDERNSETYGLSSRGVLSNLQFYHSSTKYDIFINSFRQYQF